MDTVIANYVGYFPIKEVIKHESKIDDVLTPLFFYINPLDIRNLKSEIPSIDRKVFIRVSDIIDRDMVIVVRSPFVDIVTKIEAWYMKGIIINDKNRYGNA